MTTRNGHTEGGLVVFADRTAIERALMQLGTRLELAGHAPIEVVVIGGAALNALGFIARPTRDVDVLSLAELDPACAGRTLVKCSPLPDALLDAAKGVSPLLAFMGAEAEAEELSDDA